MKDEEAARVTVGCFVLAWMLMSLAATAGLIYAAIHFIGKFW